LIIGFNLIYTYAPDGFHGCYVTFRHVTIQEIPSFNARKAQKWLDMLESIFRKCSIPEDLKYAMILHSFSTEDLRILLKEDLPKIGTFNAIPGLLYIIGELFIKW